MSLHKEISFEDDVCGHLAANGWLCGAGDAARYDRARAFFPADVIAWVQATQPDAWETITKQNGTAAEDTLLARLRDQLNQRGTLDVLRHGIELLGLKKPLQIAQFKPALAINPDILTRYAANRLRVVRQVRYSLHNENCLDLVLFLNGVPVAPSNSRPTSRRAHRTPSTNTALTDSRSRRVRPQSRCCHSRTARSCTLPSATVKCI